MTLSPRNLSLLTLIQVAAVGACGTAADGDHNGETREYTYRGSGCTNLGKAQRDLNRQSDWRRRRS